MANVILEYVDNLSQVNSRNPKLTLKHKESAKYIISILSKFGKINDKMLPCGNQIGWFCLPKRCACSNSVKLSTKIIASEDNEICILVVDQRARWAISIRPDISIDMLVSSPKVGSPTFDISIGSISEFEGIIQKII